MLLKIKTKSEKKIELETPDGKIVTIGFQKNAILLTKLSSKPIGDTVELEVKTSDVALGYSGNMYVDVGDAFLKKMLEVRKYLVDEQIVAKQLKELDA